MIELLWIFMMIIAIGLLIAYASFFAGMGWYMAKSQQDIRNDLWALDRVYQIIRGNKIKDAINDRKRGKA